MENFRDYYAETVRETIGMLNGTSQTGRSFKDRVKGLFGGGEKDSIFWPTGMLLLGLLEAGERDAVHVFLNTWKQDGMPVKKLDDALTGYVLLRLYEESGDESYLDGARAIYTFLKEAAKDSEGSFIYNPSAGNGIVAADGCGMTGMFLICYALATKEEEAFGMARAQFVNYAAHGMDESTGLPFHGYCLSTGQTAGLAGWGRAVGWLLMGLSVYVEKTNAIADAPVTGFYEDLCKSALSYLNPAGQGTAFSWNLPDRSGHIDISTTGMIGWALITGDYREKKNALQETMPEDMSIEEAAAAAMQEEDYTPEAYIGQQEDRTETGHALEGMVGSIWENIENGKVQNAQAECLDFGNYPQEFGVYPWGQGAALAFLSAHRNRAMRRRGSVPEPQKC